MTPQSTPNEWQCPPAEASEDRRLGFLNSAVEEGDSWLRSQRGNRDYKKALDIISGTFETGQTLAYRSHLSSGRLKTNIRTAISGLANIRPMWGYHADSKAFQPCAGMLNKVSRAIYLEQFFDRSIKETLQWAATTATGWIRPVYQRDQAGWGKGNIQLLSYGSPCVLPVQMPSNGDYQQAYAVSLLDEMPIYMAHSKFPDYQDRLRPTSSRYWYSSDIRQSATGNARKRAWWNPFRRKAESMLSDLYIPIRYTTVIDLSINTTGHTIPMGEPGSSWYYEVPPFDPEGKINGKVVGMNEARMYPYRRMMISSETCIMYDGPAFGWSGELDLIPFCIDQWPWEPLGFSMVHDGYEIQKALDAIDRGTMDKIMAQQDLPLGYDLNAVNKREADSFDPMQPRARIAFDGSAVDKPFAPPVPIEVYQVRPEVLTFYDKLEQALDYQLQIRDIVELGKARALGKGMDQLEALMAANGPVVKDMARGMERSLCRIGQQLKYLELQYLTTARVMQYVGEDGVTPETFDYDPATLVPSHMPGEDVHDSSSKPVGSKYSQIQRARWFAENVRFYLMPHSVHEITQMTYRLLLLQLRQRGAPIAWSTVMESCDVPDVKKADGSSVQDQYWSEKEQEITHAARAKQIVDALGLDMGGGAPGGGKERPNGSTPHGGRPPTGQQAPQLRHGGRTISESG